MAKKNDQTGAEDQAPVKSPTKWTPEGLEIQHDARRQERRELETELAEIDGHIRTAINNADLEAIDKFSARKAELPRRYIAASSAENSARQELVKAEDKANLRRLEELKTRRDALQKALAERRAEFEKELAERVAELQEAENEVGAIYSTINSSRQIAAIGDAGFRRAMAALTGV